MKFLFLLLVSFSVQAKTEDWKSRSGKYLLVEVKSIRNMFSSEMKTSEDGKIVQFDFSDNKVKSKVISSAKQEEMGKAWSLLATLNFEESKRIKRHNWALIFLICSKDVHKTSSNEAKVVYSKTTRTRYLCIWPNNDRYYVKLKYFEKNKQLKIIAFDSGEREKKVIYTYQKLEE
ncbi:MAG: hypothetical protein JNM93_12410 [Bacteriovoracaceae bacterium]|nr:hypothetical protein [Bacteriovoracaceae bacterium]